MTKHTQSNNAGISAKENSNTWAFNSKENAGAEMANTDNMVLLQAEIVNMPAQLTQLNNAEEIGETMFTLLEHAKNLA